MGSVKDLHMRWSGDGRKLPSKEPVSWRLLRHAKDYMKKKCPLY
jgi:hypothetical protein